MLPKDPYILISYINTMLRDKYTDFEDLKYDLGAEAEEAEAALKGIGYEYDRENNCFRAK